MMVRIYGFDWEAYSRLVMPAFARWLLDEDETVLARLYEQTRCAREEQFLPAVLQGALTWPRARAFVQQLPRGIHTRREYQLLCHAEHFTVLSDTYLHRHPPRLYQNSDALRVLWGALVEDYCLSGFAFPEDKQMEDVQEAVRVFEQKTEHSETVADEMVQHSGMQATLLVEQEDEKPEDGENDEREDLPPGVALGGHPALLHLRGWLAQHSVRAMALFELLACGRRRVPFDYRAGEPYESYCGYLTPSEVWQFSLTLHDIQVPDATEAEDDALCFHLSQSNPLRQFRMIDEVLPAHAEALLQVVRLAAQHGLGLICSKG